VPKELLEEWGKKDPMTRIEAVMKKQKISPKEIAAVKSAVESEISEAIEFALSKPGVDPKEAFRNVFVE
jgi:2-oxoisovalerate dehydrogenase E1 component